MGPRRDELDRETADEGDGRWSERPHWRAGRATGVGPQVGNPRDHVLHQVLVEVDPAVDAVLIQELAAVVELGVDARNARTACGSPLLVHAALLGLVLGHADL